MWIQQAVEEGRIEFAKVLGTEKVADLMTKSLKKDDMIKNLQKNENPCTNW